MFERYGVVKVEKEAFGRKSFWKSGSEDGDGDIRSQCERAELFLSHHLKGVCVWQRPRRSGGGARGDGSYRLDVTTDSLNPPFASR